MTNDEVTEQREQILDDVNIINTLETSQSNSITEEIATKDSNLLTNIQDSDSVEQCSNSNTEDLDVGRKISLTSPPMKRRKAAKPLAVMDMQNRETELKVERIKNIIQQEEEIHKLTYEHMKQKYALETRAAIAAAELAELLLKKEKEKS